MTTSKTRPRRKIDRPRIPGAPYTVEQAAAELNLAPRTVRKRIAEGKLRAYKDGRVVRIAEAELAAYRAALMGPGAMPAMGTGLSVRRHLKPARARG
jgi:excisionase family DNA binding protein